MPVSPCKISAKSVEPNGKARLNVARVYESERIADVMIVEPQSFADDRGRFLESYRRSWFPLGREMVQGSRSDKTAGSLVGLHYHLHQADYWYVLQGRAQVVLHDLRVGSETEGRTLEIEAGDSNEIGVFIPPGVAHGFVAITDMTLTYLVDSYYNPSDEVSSIYIGENEEFDSKVLRYEYSSMITPRSVFDLDLESGSSTLLKQTEVLGDFAGTNYTTFRVWADARDGVFQAFHSLTELFRGLFGRRGVN